MPTQAYFLFRLSYPRKPSLGRVIGEYWVFLSQYKLAGVNRYFITHPYEQKLVFPVMRAYGIWDLNEQYFKPTPNKICDRRQTQPTWIQQAETL